MKQLLACLLAALMLLSLLPVLPASAENAAPCDALQYTVLLVPRAGEALTVAAARAGMTADDFALTPAGQEALSAADARLAALEAAATEACHCLTVENRFRVSMLGLAVTVDITDLPELRALGDTSPEDAAFDLHLPASYAPLSAESTDTAPADLPTAPTPPSVAGEGSVIAILDTGFSPNEAYFTLPDGTASVLQGDALAARLALIGKTAEGASAKIPFLYNYAEPGAAIDTQAAHGTEIAALAAANGQGDFAGGAPAAQLLCMKVFGETDALADELTLIAAIEDALLLGADVINISLGQPDGGANGGSGLALALAGAERAGVSVICAAGNNAETGEGSIFIGTTGQNLFPTAYPDRGLTAAPASFAGSFSVGAALGSYFTLPMLLDGGGRKIVYSDSCGDFFTDPQYSGMATDFLHLMQHAAGGNNFAYVAVPGVGAADDYTGLDLLGKVALVERGTISFAEKTQHAAAAGAIAVIIYDNDPETDGSLNMELTDAKLPAVIISVADGQRLAAAGSGTLSFPDDRTSPRGQHVTDVTAFSSRGMRDDYTLSPNLVAPGQNFLGLTAGGGVTLLTGTSYAAAQMTGATAALLTRIRTQGLADGTDAAQLAEVLLQNTAMPIMTDGVPVTVRAQGAGLLNPVDAMRTPIAVSGNDGGAVTATGAEQSFSLTFTLRNLTDQPRTAQLIPSALADDYAQPDLSAVENRDAVERLLAAYGWEELPLCTTGRLRTLPDTRFSLDGREIGADGIPFTLEAGEIRTLTLEVTLSDADYAAYSAAFPNGFPVEGRIQLQLEGEADPLSLTVPWIVFCGDRADSPIFSTVDCEEGEHLYRGQQLSVVTNAGATKPLGELPLNPENGVMGYDTALAAFNPRNCSSLQINLCLLRKVSHWTVSVTDAGGEVVYTDEGGVLNRAYGIDALAVSEHIRLWNGRAGDNPNYICPDGWYTVTLTLYGLAGGEQTLTLPVRIDTAAPTLQSAAFSRSETGKLMLDLTIADDAYLRSVILSDRWEYNTFEDGSLAPDTVLAAGEGAEIAFSAVGTDYADTYLYVTLEDWAGNRRVVRLNRSELFDAFIGQP